MKKSGFTALFLAAITLTGTVQSQVAPPPFSPGAYLKADNTGALDVFGSVVAISGNTAVVGAPGEDSVATTVNGNGADDSSPQSGAAYVYVKTGDVWAFQAYLKPRNSEADDQFGASVAISGDLIVVGAPDEDSNATGVNGSRNDNSALSSGAAYVFVRSGNSWRQRAYLKASNTEAGDRFGASVAIAGNTVIVGAPGEDSGDSTIDGNQLDNTALDAGAAYVFSRSAGVWSQQAYLKADNIETDDRFGSAVAVSGDTAVVSSPLEDSASIGVGGDGINNNAPDSGAAYVFFRVGGVWSQQAYLKAGNTEGTDGFGAAVAISGDTIVVGNPGDDSDAVGTNGDGQNNNAPDAGSAHVFVRNINVWSQEAYLKAGNAETGDQFGGAVSVSGDIVVVGATGEDSSARGVNGNELDNGAADSGAAYVFVRAGMQWNQRGYLKAGNSELGDLFGRAVAVSGDNAIVTAEAEDSAGTGVTADPSDNQAGQSGAAYTFNVPTVLEPAVIIRTIAGNGASLADNIPAYEAQFVGVGGLTIDTADNLYVSDPEGHRVRVIEATNGIIATIAGMGTPGFSGDGVAGPAALLSSPTGISYDDNLKRIVISDSVNERIRAFNLLNGLIGTIGGNGTNGQSGDGGPAISAEISTPSGIVAHPDGSIYFATASNTVRRIDPAGNISTVAGNGTNGFSGDLGPATNAMLNVPTGLAFDEFANLFIADSGNHRIRRVDAQTGIITTYAGTGTRNFNGDLGLAVDAELDTPGYITFAANGDLYFTDTGNQVVRYIERDSKVIHTFAGVARQSGFTGDGGDPLLARLDSPAGLVFDSRGNLYVADRNNQRIRKIEQLPLSVFNYTDLLPGQSIPLFTNNHLLHFEAANGGQVPWRLAASNVLEVLPGTGHVVTKQDFDAFHLHVEFRLPNDGSDGNGGIYLQNRYEIQIFNSFGKPVLDNNDCGAIWGRTAPAVNACLAPGVWQSLEITFHPAQWNSSTNKVSNARVTVALNGSLLHNNVEITASTQAGTVETNTPGPILFQDHGTRVQFRNIVITPFDTAPRFEWVRAAGSTNAFGGVEIDEAASGISSDRMGNVYVAGGFLGQIDFGGTNVQSAGETDAFLAKYSPGGDLQWVVRGGGPGKDRFTDVAVAPDGTVVVSGSTETNATYSGTAVLGAGSSDILVAKYAADGGLQWLRTIGDAQEDKAHAVAVDDSGQIFVTGLFQGTNFYPNGAFLSSAFGSRDAFVARFAPDGSTVWARGGGGLLTDSGNDVVPDGDGGAYFAGLVGSSAQFGPITVANAGNAEAFAAHVDANGFFRWFTNSTSFSNDRHAQSIARGPNGDLYISGPFLGDFVFGGNNRLAQIGQPGTHDIFLAQISPLGQPGWLRQVAGDGDDGQANTRLATDQEGGIYLAGAIGGDTTFSSIAISTNGSDDIFIAKYADTGDVQWARSARGFGRDGAASVHVSETGRILLGGFFSAVASFDGITHVSQGGLDIFAGQLGSTLSQLPVSQWRFDDTNSPTVPDHFGAFNGMLSSTGAVHTGGGFSTNAVFVNSTNNGYVNFGDVPLTGRDPLTISVAIRIDPSKTNHMVVLSQHDTNFNRGLILGVNGLGTNGTPGKVFFTDTGTFADAIVSQADVVDGRWHSVVVTYQPYGVKALYVDGVQQAFGGAKLFPPGDAPLVAGGLSAGGMPFGNFTGLIDELVIYRRVLSAEEIAVQSVYPDEQIEPFVPDAFEWVRQGYASNIVATAVTTDANGDIYVVGGFSDTAEFGTNVVTAQFFGTDAFIAKYNSQGDVLWVRTGGGNGVDIANDVVVDSQGFIVVGGDYEATATFDGLFLTAGFGGGGQLNEYGFVAKYTASGTIVRLIDGWGHVNAVAVDGNNNIYATGTGRLNRTRNGIALQTNGGQDIWVAKYDFVGNVQWARNYGGNGDDGADAMDVTAAGDIYITGEFSGIFSIAGSTLFQQVSTQGANQETFVIRIDPAIGDPVWARQGAGALEEINDSFFDARGRYNVVGTTFGSLSFQSINIPAAAFTGFRAGFNQFGTPLLGQTYMQEMKGMTASGTNNVYVFGEIFNSNAVTLAGRTLVSRGQADALLLKINDDGTNQFVRQIGGQGNDQAARGNSVSVDASGNVYLAGYSDNNNGAPIQFENLASVPDNRSSMWLVKAPSEVQIVRHPTDLVATNLDSTFFRVLPAGQHPFTYQWYFNGTNPIPGGNSALLRLDSLALIQEGEYHVEVSNIHGRAVSRRATLTVALPPIIVSEPPDRSAGLNRSSTFSVVVGGIGPFSYQWHYNGVPITDATNASHTVSNISIADEGFYHAVIVNQFGSATTRAAQLTTFPAGILPEVLTQPADSTNAVGSFVSFNITTGGQHPLFFQWLKNGVPLPGRTQPFLQLFDLQLADSGNYSVYITNVFGNTTSSNAFLSVFVPQIPAITVEPVGRTVSVGANVTFDVTATGSPVLRYQWLYNNSVIPNATNPTFNIPGVNLSHAGDYRVQVFNDAGAVTSVNAPLVVHQAPFMIAEPQSINPSNRQPAMILSSVGGFPLPGIQWFRDGTPLINGTDYLGTDAQTLSILSATIDNVGTYFLVASNVAGAVTSAPASLVLNFPAQILAHPVSAAVPAGTNHTLSISVTGAPPISIQWFHNGAPILGANFADLTFNNATRADTGVYHAFANNASGSETSSNATLRVVVPQRLLSPVFNTDRFEFTFGESDGALLVQTNLPPLAVQFTTNFSGWFDPTNSPVFTNGQLFFRDILPPALHRRYYRVIEQ